MRFFFSKRPKPTWDLGNFTGPRTVKINLSTIVEDVLSNQNGTRITNFVESIHKSPEGINFSGNDTANTTIIEPDLQILKVADVTETESGATIRYNITVSHTSESASPAYDFNITDLIPAGLKLTTTDPAANYTSANNATWKFAVLPLGATKKLSYTVTVNSTVTAGEMLRNKANVTWTSTAGSNPDERFGDYTALDDYNRTTYYPVRISTQSGLTKMPDVSRNASIGYPPVNYTTFLDLPRAIVLNLWVNDTLPLG